ncbi:unnamed protein product [Trichobilharzia regenti]|nr:unnamed protein product [Trichobilharzia regenti]
MRTRAIIRRGAASVEPTEDHKDSPRDDDDDGYDDNENGNAYGYRGMDDNINNNTDEYLINYRLPRSSTVITTVSGEPLLTSPGTRYHDKTNEATIAGGGGGSGAGNHGYTQNQQSNKPTRAHSHNRAISPYDRQRHSRRSSSQTNEHDMLIPGQPLIYNATITAVNRSGHGSRGPYTSLGPGHFRIAGRAPLAYDTTSVGTTSPVQTPRPTMQDALQFSFENDRVQRNSLLISSNQNEKSLKPVLFEDEVINKSSRSCFTSCLQWISSFFRRLFGRNDESMRSKKSGNLGQDPGGIKGPKEFATLRAMAALAAATAATAVADPTKAAQGGRSA